MSEHHVQGSRHVGEIEGLDEQARVPDLPPATAAHEAPKLLLERALSPRRLPLEGSEGSEVALRVDHVLDRGRPERSDQLVLQVRDAHEEADAFHGGACEVGPEVGALETSAELTLFPDVAETRQPDVETLGAVATQVAPDGLRAYARFDAGRLS